MCRLAPVCNGQAAMTWWVGFDAEADGILTREGAISEELYAHGEDRSGKS